MMQHGPWQILQRHEVYRDPWIQLHQDDVLRPDGQPGTFSVVHLKPGICALAQQDELFYFTEEFHYGVGRSALEGVSGGIEAGEEPLDTARREMVEELGIEARQWIDLGSVDPFTTSIVSPTRLFLARDLQLGPQQLESTERIRRVELSCDEAFQRVLDGRITHALTCLLILRARLC
ncbi:MAG: NUDIX domain-containing protein [Gemmataceae bacterium]